MADKKCPHCGGRLIQRRNKRGGESVQCEDCNFWGAGGGKKRQPTAAPTQRKLRETGEGEHEPRGEQQQRGEHEPEPQPRERGFFDLF